MTGGVAPLLRRHTAVPRQRKIAETERLYEGKGDEHRGSAGEAGGKVQGGAALFNRLHIVGLDDALPARSLDSR